MDERDFSWVGICIFLCSMQSAFLHQNCWSLGVKAQCFQLNFAMFNELCKCCLSNRALLVKYSNFAYFIFMYGILFFLDRNQLFYFYFPLCSICIGLSIFVSLPFYI